MRASAVAAFAGAILGSAYVCTFRILELFPISNPGPQPLREGARLRLFACDVKSHHNQALTAC